MEERIFYFFAYDTITYILKKKQMHFKDCHDAEDFKNTPRRFQPCWGDAVLNYRESRRDFFFKLMEDYPGIIFENDIALNTYMKITARNVTRGESFCMDILRYFAFCADLAIHCHTSGSSNLIVFLPEYMDFLKEGVERQAFRVVGGYHSLIRLAEQFVEYKNFKLKDYPPKEIAKDIEVESIGFKPVEEANQAEIAGMLQNILESMSVSITRIPLENICESDQSVNVFENVEPEKICENVPSDKVGEKDSTEKIYENLPSEKACENLKLENVPSKKVFVNVSFEKVCETKPDDIQKLPDIKESYSRTEESYTISEVNRHQSDLNLPSTSSNAVSSEKQTECEKSLKTESAIESVKTGEVIIAIQDDIALQNEPKSVKKGYDEDGNLGDKTSGPSPQKKQKNDD